MKITNIVAFAVNPLRRHVLETRFAGFRWKRQYFYVVTAWRLLNKVGRLKSWKAAVDHDSCKWEYFELVEDESVHNNSHENQRPPTKNFTLSRVMTRAVARLSAKDQLALQNAWSFINWIVFCFQSGPKRASASKYGHDQTRVAERHGPVEGYARTQQPRGNFRVNWLNYVATSGRVLKSSFLSLKGLSSQTQCHCRCFHRHAMDTRIY